MLKLQKVLHLSIDFLIGNIIDKETLRMSHKYGFQNPEDFLLTVTKLSRFYRNLASKTDEEDFSKLTSQMNQLVPIVLSARQRDITKYLERWEFSKINMFIESFAWETKLILGDSSFGGNITQKTTLNINYSYLHLKNNLFFEMNMEKLNDFIFLLEISLVQ
ncbi:hypothetical protein KR018_005666 [Drosophila ironensis]|nr:hypothetical protein KR018_005666 [Drosophila ironensis]